MTEASLSPAAPTDDAPRVRRRGPLSRVFRWLLALWVLAALLVLAGLVAMQLAGWKLHIIESDSMAPTVPRDSLVAVSPVSADEIGVGDIVIFRDPLDRDRFVMDRVVSMTSEPGAQALQTKGDANAEPDPELVSASSVEGRLRLHVRYAGRLARHVGEPAGIAVLVGVPVVLLLLSEIAARRYRRRKARAAEQVTAAQPPLPPPVSPIESVIDVDAPADEELGVDAGAAEEEPAAATDVTETDVTGTDGTETRVEPEPPYESSVDAVPDDTPAREADAQREQLARAMQRADSTKAHDLLAQWRAETEQRIQAARQHAHELLPHPDADAGAAPAPPAPTPAERPSATKPARKRASRRKAATRDST
ncbi:MAG: signal peptidase I [Mycobacteriales bacterium]|nr:signal peptidase I [Frankia sp.]